MEKLKNTWIFAIRQFLFHSNSLSTEGAMYGQAPELFLAHQIIAKQYFMKKSWKLRFQQLEKVFWETQQVYMLLLLGKVVIRPIDILFSEAAFIVSSFLVLPITKQISRFNLASFLCKMAANYTSLSRIYKGACFSWIEHIFPFPTIRKKNYEKNCSRQASLKEPGNYRLNWIESGL